VVIYSTGPPSFFRDSWDQMCFEIQNVSDFRKVIRFMYRRVHKVPNRALGNTP